MRDLYCIRNTPFQPWIYQDSTLIFRVDALGTEKISMIKYKRNHNNQMNLLLKEYVNYHDYLPLPVLRTVHTFYYLAVLHRMYELFWK